MGKPEMTPTLAVLDDLSYALECAVCDHIGEAKWALMRLCDRLEHNPAYAVRDHAELAVKLRDAHACLVKFDLPRAGEALSVVTRQMWQRYLGGE